MVTRYDAICRDVVAAEGYALLDAGDIQLRRLRSDEEEHDRIAGLLACESKPTLLGWDMTVSNEKFARRTMQSCRRTSAISCAFAMRSGYVPSKVAI
jgi:hypothetical protein